jgi:hypothetical protein
MMPRRTSGVLVLAGALALGCSTARAPGPASAAGEAASRCADEVLASPALLREHGDAALQRQELERAYRCYALIRQLHPESEESETVYPVAASIFQRLWEQDRYVREDSIWHTSEPVFLYAWLETFFLAGDFPQQRVHQLLKGSPYPLTERFIEWARTRPALATWRFEVEDDNGRVTAIQGIRDESRGRSTLGSRPR